MATKEINERSGIYGIFGPSGKVYVGSAINLSNRLGKHRGVLKCGMANSHLQRSWNKYGGEAFHFVVLENCTGLSAKELLPREQSWMDKYRGCLYNLAPVAGSCAGVKHSDEFKAKISARMLGNKRSLGFQHSDETKLKWRGNKHRLGKKLGEDHKRRLSAALLGNKHTLGKKASDETKAKMRAAQLGKTLSEEHKAKIRSSQSGRKKSSEQISKNRAGHIGLKHSDETKRKMSVARLGNKNALKNKYNFGASSGISSGLLF
jgi:group I intron endonuclease